MMVTLKMKKVEPMFKGSRGRMLRYIDKYIKRINKYDYDFFIVVCGKERRGKSTLAIQIGYYISNGTLTVDNICMDADQFTTALQNSKKGDVIIFDEAGTNLFSREAMSTVNRMLTKGFMVSGLKNICIILCIPSFFSLDTYIRTHRIDLLVNIPKRGRWKAYSHRRAKIISLKGSKMKNMGVVRDNEFGTFPKSFPGKELEKAYRKKEIAYKLKYIGEIKKNIEGYFTSSQFCRITGYNMKTLYRWIKSNKITHKKIGGRIYIPKTEAERTSFKPPEETSNTKDSQTQTDETKDN